MPIVPLYGHAALRARLSDAVEHGTLPGSILLHGPRGVGKQRLALWLAQLLLCEAGSSDRPCGLCVPCRHALQLRHPDLYWFYPRARLKDPDPTPSDVLEDYAEGTMERVEHHGLYAPPSGTEGLYVATIRTIVQRAGLAPAMGRRKVFIVGDAERMVSQEGADQAANAFLKLLEEPLPDTTIILTSSEPGALLPTIRSRVVAFRSGPLSENDVRAFLSDPVVTEGLRELDVPPQLESRVLLAAGTPGVLLAGATLNSAMVSAREMIAAAERRDRATMYATAMGQGVSGARGSFSDTLDALQRALRDRARDAIARGDLHTASGASRAIDAVLQAQTRADGNVNPQLIAAELLQALAASL